MKYDADKQGKYNAAVMVIIISILMFTAIIIILFGLQYLEQAQQPDFFPPSDIEVTP